MSVEATVDSPKMSEFDAYLWGSGKHQRAYRKLGAHLTHQDGVEGVHFSVWAPNAARISVIGEFNEWSRHSNPMRHFDRKTGIWSLFIPGVPIGAAYKYCVIAPNGGYSERCDPYGYWSELRPSNASRVWDLGNYAWADAHWMEQRRQGDVRKQPMSIYEVHLGSWMRKLDNSWMTYRELATRLVDYVVELGATHVELLPFTEHPYDGSWGYQTTGYFAATSRFGNPDDLRFLIDRFHQNNIGVILDWVPAHFPKDGHGLAYFDGTHLYEHADPRQGFHPEWGTLIFNYGRNEVRNFLISSALFWLEHYHVDGLRVDAVASMLYLDYGRNDGQWIANRLGGRENLEAIAFLQELNQAIAEHHPDVFTVAEESTAFPGVSHPVSEGGLGFTFKWNMGWMHDTLDYFQKDPLFRSHHHNKMTFGMTYQYSENFVLPFSHDEVVHLKKSMLSKMPGDEWKMRANLRTLYGYMFGYPGKKLLFMGAEFGQWSEWNEARGLAWEQLSSPNHRALLKYSQDLFKLYRAHSQLWELDHDPEGFRWLDCDDAPQSFLIFLRHNSAGESLLFLCNFTPLPRSMRVQLPWKGEWKLLLNSDSAEYGGSDLQPLPPGKTLTAEPIPHRGQEWSCEMTLPPLSTLVFSGKRPPERKQKPKAKAKAAPRPELPAQL